MTTERTWAGEMVGELDTINGTLSDHEKRLARLEADESVVEVSGGVAYCTRGSVKIIDHNHEQPDKAQPNEDLEAAKAAARQAVEEPEPAPLPEAGDRPRSPAEMVGAVLSNLTLCIEADTLDEAVQYAKQAQRWALILKREVK